MELESAAAQIKLPTTWSPDAKKWPLARSITPH